VEIFCPLAFSRSFRNWSWSRAKIASWGLTRKKYLSPRSVRVGEEESEQTYGILSRSAAWLAVLVTELWYAPIMATTFSWVMRRSASDCPFRGSPLVSAKTTSIFAPPRLGMPAVLARGRFRSGYFPLMMSTASSTPRRQSRPVEAMFPVSG